MKRLKRKTQKLVLYQTVFVELPFPDHSFVETISVPFWRLFADDCVVLFNTKYTHIDLAMALIKAWDLRYVTCLPTHSIHTKNPVIIAAKGNAELLWDLSPELKLPEKRGIFDLIKLWGSPKLAVNLNRKSTVSAFKGWRFTSPTGSKEIDPYYYPLRKNGYNIDESLTDLYAAIRHEWQNIKSSEWKIIERFAILLINSRTTKLESTQLVSTLTNNGISQYYASQWVRLIQEIHNGLKVDYSRPVQDYLIFNQKDQNVKNITAPIMGD